MPYSNEPIDRTLFKSVSEASKYLRDKGMERHRDGVWSPKTGKGPAQFCLARVTLTGLRYPVGVEIIVASTEETLNEKLTNCRRLRKSIMPYVERQGV